jgi:tetratricopeptide (TPR) repeat protein
MTDQAGDRLEEISEDFLTFVHEEALARNAEDVESLTFLAQVFSRQGRHQEGLDLDRRLVALRPENAIASYNLACSLALTSEFDGALEELRRAVSLGYHDADHVAGDTDLDGLRDHPGFADLIGEMKRRP